MVFTDFVGNEKVKEQLSYLRESNRLPHAIIIEGEEGLGKRTFAREIALNLFCRGEQKPCRNCPQCSKVLQNIHPDIYEYSATGGARSFHVDVVREVKEDVYMQPNEAEYKVYILGNCQCMSDNAQNALLKVLEEPPKYALFILTTTTKSAMLETVLSRSVVITLEGVDEKKATDYILEKYPEYDQSQVIQAVTVWGGNIGKAIASLGDSKLSKISSIAVDVCNALNQPHEYDLLKVCSVFEKDRETIVSTMSLLKTIFRDALLYSDDSDVLSGQKDIAKKLSQSFSKRKLLNLISACDNLTDLTVKNGNNAILITKICFDFRSAIGR